MSKRRVVITGLGAVTPLGPDLEETFTGLLEGRSGVSTFSRFDISAFSTRFMASVRDFHPEEFLDRRMIKRMDPFAQYAVVASIEALRDSGLDLDREDATRIACIMGTGIGGITEIEDQKVRLQEKGPRLVNPLLVPKMMFNSLTGHVALFHRLKGPNFATGSACASGTHAIGVAFRFIQYGDADVVVTGGSEAANTGLGLAGFGSMKALSTRNDDPQGASRPFDRERDGFVLGEGCGVLILEELERARRRGARIYGELKGFGSSDDAFHLTAPDETGEGPCRSMETALRDSGIDLSTLDYINAHGTSTPLNDRTETQAIKRVLGAQASKVQISSTKSMIGHLLGASGAVECAVTAKSLFESRLHPTINYEYPDPDCDLDYIPNEAREHRIRNAMTNSFGFGGTNATLVLGELDPPS